MDGYQSDELFDGSPLLQTSCSSSESGDSEPEADSSRDKHIEFMRIAFRAKQPQQLDSARTKTNSAKPSSTFLTHSRPHSSTHQENTSTAGISRESFIQGSQRQVHSGRPATHSEEAGRCPVTQ